MGFVRASGFVRDAIHVANVLPTLRAGNMLSGKAVKTMKRSYFEVYKTTITNGAGGDWRWCLWQPLSSGRACVACNGPYKGPNSAKRAVYEFIDATARAARSKVRVTR